jgi:3-dehydroquinate synthase class II
MDVEIQRQLAFPKLPAVWLAKITEITTGTKPLKIKRGNHEAYAYVSNTVRAILSKLAVGDSVPIMFIDGDRDKPVVIS